MVDFKIGKFVEEFMTNLEFEKAGYIAFANKENGHTEVEIIAQQIIFENGQCIPISCTTAPNRGMEILSKLEQKYKIKRDYSELQNYDPKNVYINLKDFLHKNDLNSNPLLKNDAKPHKKK